MPGRTCWRVEHAQRFGLLIDGDHYFRAVRAALANARHSILILGWDIDSRTRLVPEGADDGYPEALGDFLNALLAQRRELRIYVLMWDFAMLFAFEREWLPIFKPDWRTHRRLSMRFDARHPVGASHHQKIIVVDDAIAFVGGFDLTQRRWDTSAHDASNPLRCDVDGRPYPPRHDVGALVDGDVARALGELSRNRWHAAGGRRVSVFVTVASDPWPDCCRVDAVDLDVGICRTAPAFEASPGVDEIRQLHLEAISRTRRDLFLENQYFSSGLICDALAARLRESSAPEIVLLTHRTENGWLEAATMGVLRARNHGRLKAADTRGRYRAYSPEVEGLDDHCLNVHSKVLIADDDLLTLGSANLSNRSMGFDTECNLAIESRGSSRLQSLIGGFRNRLLAEHLGTTRERLAATMNTCGSLISTIETLRGEGRTLCPLDPAVPPEIDAIVPEAALLDPERPMNSDELVDAFVPSRERPSARTRMLGLAVVTLAIALLAVAWRWTSLGEWLELDALIAFANRIDELPLTPLFVLAAYVLAAVLVVPVTIVIAATGAVFGPVVGALYALCGATLSAAATYGIGVLLGRETVRRVAGPRLNALSRKLAKRGLLAMIFVRLVPIAPFTIVNMVAGASHIGFRDFLLGTLVGLTPGILATVVFVDQVVAAVRNPGLSTFVMLAIVAGALGGGMLLLHRLLARRQASSSGMAK